MFGTRASRKVTEVLGRVAPGLAALWDYRIADDLRFDFVAGLSVAAVALPVAVAYAELAASIPSWAFIQAFCPYWPTLYSAPRDN